MPFKWDRGINLYVHNHFGRLRLGPNNGPRQIVAQAKNLAQKLAAGGPVELAGQKLDEHAINEASNRLREPGPLAQELLLVHPQTQKESSKLRALADRLRQLAVFPDEHFPLDLVHPLSLFWFIPAPGVEAAELPEWAAFQLVEAGDPQDLELDIVFDC